jgi:hypothetical protein
VPVFRLPASLVTGAPNGALTASDQRLFRSCSIYLDIQAKSQVRWGFADMWGTG